LNATNPKTVSFNAMAKSTSIKIKTAATSKPAIAKPASGARVALELIKPEAKQVFVAGSFNQWKPEATPLVPKGNGKWVGDLSVKPGRHEYLFVVDGQWMADPKARESVQNPFGGRNSVVVVSE
jgi:1,4-alpha-glucan branching enzyme